MLNFLHWQAAHVGGIIRQCKQCWCHLVDALICALGRQQYGHQQRIGVVMLQWDRRLRVKGSQMPQDKIGAFSFQHHTGGGRRRPIFPAMRWNGHAGGMSRAVSRGGDVSIGSLAKQPGETAAPALCKLPAQS